MRHALLCGSLALFLAGCVSLPANPATMTEGQLREWVKDKNANIYCITVGTPYKANAVALVLDRGIVLDGTLTVGDDCKITMTNAPKPK